jgi:outer membrane biosynthesis protein TonB
MQTHAKVNAFMLSLVMHLILIVILLTSQYEHLLPPENIGKEIEEAADIPVIFEEIPEEQKNNIVQQTPPPLLEQPVQTQPPKPLKNMIADFVDGQPTPVQTPRHSSEKKIIHKPTSTQQEEPQEKQITSQPTSESFDFQDTRLNITEHGVAIAMPTQKQESKNPQTKQLSPLQKKLTLAELVEGFLHPVDEQSTESESEDANGGMHALRVKTGRKGHASEKQLMHELFYKKIIACIGNSFKIHRHKAPLTEQPHRAAIQMAIKRDGSIYTLQVLQSSGNRAIDDFALFLLKDASLSFPSVPKFFDTDIYTFIPFAFDTIFDFGYPEGWMIGPVEH